MAVNIIVKKGTPSWRPLQPVLGAFHSKDKKNSSNVSPVHSVEEQFDKEELMKIAKACRFTAAMGNPSIQGDLE